MQPVNIKRFWVQPVNIKRFCTIAKKMRLDPRIRTLAQTDCIHPILWIRNPKTLTRPLGFLIFTTAFKKFAWSPRALGQFLIPLPRPQAILGCSLSISSDFALLLKRCVSTRGFGCTDRELLAPQICRDMTVFVSRNKKSTESRPLISYLMDFLNMRSGVCHPPCI